MSRKHPAVIVDVVTLGARGDGIALWEDLSLFVAGALPGERVSVRPGKTRGEGREAGLVEILHSSEQRTDPPCPHFAVCGGCVAQHMTDEAYAAWKRGHLIDTLRRRGFADPPVLPLASAPPGARRRARFALHAGTKGLRPAFRSARSHDLVVPAVCPVLEEPLLATATAVAAVLAPRGALELEVTRTEAGCDAMVIARRPPNPDESFDLAAVAEQQDMARIAWREEGRPPYLLADRRAPRLTAGAVEVALPAGAFVQPTAWGEAAIGQALAAILPTDGTLADLFAGCGVLGLALAQGRTVEAFESVGPMVAAARQAALAAGLPDYRAHERDLEQAPLEPAALARFDAVLLDPPRGGARAQCEALAASAVPTIAYVSCHPGSFSRDARILVDGGYEMLSVAPLDQFLWSHHLELIGHFARR